VQAIAKCASRHGDDLVGRVVVDDDADRCFYYINNEDPANSIAYLKKTLLSALRFFRDRIE